MGRKPAKPDKKRTSILQIKFTGDEHAALWRVVADRIAEDHRATASEYIRELVRADPAFQKALKAIAKGS